MCFHFTKKRFSCFFQNVFSQGLSVLRACSNVNSEGNKCDNATEAAPAYPHDDDPRRQDSGHFVAQETDEIIHPQSQRMQTGVCVTTLFFMMMFHFFYTRFKTDFSSFF